MQSDIIMKEEIITKKGVLVIAMAACMAASLTVYDDGAKETIAVAETTAAAAAGDTTTAAEGTPAVLTGGVLKIGGIGPVAGSAAVYGIVIQNGAQLAVDEVNAAGGISGMQVEFKLEDNEHDAEKSINACNTLKDWGMEVLMGTVTSNPCIAIAEKAKEDSVFMLTPSGSTVECVQYGNVFRVCFSDPNQGAASAQYIGENKLASKVAAIYDNSDVYSSGIYEKFAAETKNQGIEVASAEAFATDNNMDLTVQLQRAREAGAELVFLPIYYTQASQILTQANIMGYASMFFGCDGLNDILAAEGFDTSFAENVMLLTPFAADVQDDLTKSFVTSFKAAYIDTPIQLAADAYDAIYTVKAAAEKSGVTAGISVSDKCEAIKTGMTQIILDDLTGEGMTWTADGEPSKAPKVVKIVDGTYTAMR